ncbi:hypothetical protein EDB89DRAFT_1296269 [Lactarius sanguifluus]|nr:hypothetical protein EDB89DRAFT_1296269 [Lactarius sanguifluus]
MSALQVPFPRATRPPFTPSLARFPRLVIGEEKKRRIQEHISEPYSVPCDYEPMIEKDYPASCLAGVSQKPAKINGDIPSRGRCRGSPDDFPLHENDGNTLQLPRIVSSTLTRGRSFMIVVKPPSPITDYLTCSSARPCNNDALRRADALINSSTILLGRSLESNLHALQFSYLRCIGTAIPFYHPRKNPDRRSGDEDEDGKRGNTAVAEIAMATSRLQP